MYLNADSQRRSDAKFYTQCFKDRLERDLDLAGDQEFKDRFINGYELTDVPRFRTDETGWHTFTVSFGRQILFDGLKARKISKVRNAIFEALDEANVNTSAIDTSKKLITKIRRYWNSVGGVIAEYHDHES